MVSFRTLGFVGWRRNFDGLGQLYLNGINCQGDEPDIRICASNRWFATGTCTEDVIIHCLSKYNVIMI